MMKVKKRYSDLWNCLGSALRKQTHARVERVIKCIATLKYLGIKDLSKK
jgi:hypothetical protein